MVVMRVVKNCLLVILWCVCLPASIMAQNVLEVMQGNKAVYDLMTVYIENSNLTEDFARKNNSFRNLFASTQTEVYMDHLYWRNENEGRSEDKVNLTEYCKYYQGQQGGFSKGSYHLSGINIALESATEEKALYKVSLTKEYRLDVQKEKKTVYHLEMIVEYSFYRKSAQIVSVKCPKPPKAMENFLKAYYVKKDDAPLYVPNTVKVLNSDGVKIRLGEEVQGVRKSSYDKLLRNGSIVYQYQQTENKRKETGIYVETIKNAVGFELGYGHAMSSKMSLDNVEMAGVFDESAKFSGHQFNFGVLYLRQVFAQNRHRLSVETGLQFALYKQRFKASSYQENVKADDADGSSYMRNTLVNNYNEVSRAFRFSIPVAARYDIYVIRDLSIFAMAGLKFNLMFWRPTTADFDASYSGQYGPELFNLFIDQNGFYDFGQFKGNKLDQKRNKAVGFNLEGMLTFGLQYHFSESWSVEACAAVQYKLTQANNQKTGLFRLTTDNTNFQSVNEYVGEGRHSMEYQIRIKYNF